MQDPAVYLRSPDRDLGVGPLLKTELNCITFLLMPQTFSFLTFSELLYCCGLNAMITHF